jgi:hypothetical protein
VGEAPTGTVRGGHVYLFLGVTGGLLPHAGLGQAGLSTNRAGDRFGSSLDSGDFDGDGKIDLAVGAPGDQPPTGGAGGLVFSFKGDGTTLSRWKIHDQTGMGTNENGDKFGQAIAAGDFNGDGKTDLAVGAPGEAPSSNPMSGYLFVLKGAAGGLQAWTGLGHGR